MTRKYFDYSKYNEEKAKLLKPDGKHCIICGCELPKYKRLYCSFKCYQEWRITFKIIDWSSLKSEALERDNYKCQICNETQNLNVHHIIPIYDGGEEFDINNTITLCSICHKKAHKDYRNKKQNQIKEQNKKRLMGD